jgi:hypothetical protein
MRYFHYLVIGVFLTFSCFVSVAGADTFGNGENSFENKFVPIGSPGNPADTTGDPNPAGSVPYSYRIGKYEISEQMIDKVNALGNLGITKDTRGPDKPATSIDWFEAARFVNWLNESTGHTPAYKFVNVIGPRGGVIGTEFALWEPSDVGYNSCNLFRNRFAKYFLPSADEWYKAAYFDPATNTWYDFPTGSNMPSTSVAGGIDPGTAIYRQELSAGPADIMNAGGLSPYGTMAQGGNVGEWEESAMDLLNNNTAERRGGRGDNWQELGAGSAPVRSGGFPSIPHFAVGFRVVSIPEPNTMVIVISVSLFVLPRRSFS